MYTQKKGPLELKSLSIIVTTLSILYSSGLDSEWDPTTLSWKPIIVLITVIPCNVSGKGDWDLRVEGPTRNKSNEAINPIVDS